MTPMGTQFDGKQCREQFVTPLSGFPQSRCNSLAFWTPVLHLPLDHDIYGGVDPLGVFPPLLKNDFGYYFAKTEHNFSWDNPSGIVSCVLAVS